MVLGMTLDRAPVMSNPTPYPSGGFEAYSTTEVLAPHSFFLLWLFDWQKFCVPGGGSGDDSLEVSSKTVYHPSPSYATTVAKCESSHAELLASGSTSSASVFSRWGRDATLVSVVVAVAKPRCTKLVDCVGGRGRTFSSLLCPPQASASPRPPRTPPRVPSPTNSVKSQRWESEISITI